MPADNADERRVNRTQSGLGKNTVQNLRSFLIVSEKPVRDAMSKSEEWRVVFAAINERKFMCFFHSLDFSLVLSLGQAKRKNILALRIDCLELLLSIYLLHYMRTRFILVQNYYYNYENHEFRIRNHLRP